MALIPTNFCCLLSQSQSPLTPTQSMTTFPILYVPAFLSPLPLPWPHHPIIPLPSTPLPLVFTRNPSRRPHIAACTPPAAKSPDIWSLVKAAVPLSVAFSDIFPRHSLHQTAPEKYKLSCPFHDDKTPSLYIDDSLATFHCFGCSAGGTIIDLEKLSGGHTSVHHALIALANRYPSIAKLLGSRTTTLPPPPASPPNPRPRVRKPALVEKNSILAVLRHAVIHYQHALWDPSTPDALRYLVHHRRLSEPTLRAFAVGYALPSVTADLLQHALANQHLPHQLVQAGLARSPQPGQVLDLFRARVVTPIRDLTGSTLAVAGRVLPPSHPRVPKYINGPETAVFRKKDALFGIDFAARAPSAQADHGYVVIVEGYMDVMTMFEMTEGRVACVATMGAAMSQSQLSKAYDLLKDPVDGKLIINFDADEAGITAVERLCHSIIPQSECPHIVYIAIPPPPVKDPDEFLRLVGKADEYVMYLLESALPWYEWLGDRIVQEELERMISVRPQTLDWTSQIQDDDIEPSTLRTIGSSEDKFDFLHAEFLRKQRDDMLVSFGAPVDVPKARQNMPAEWKCSEEVVERLSEIIVSAQKCLPGLNTSALVQSWADSLSLGKPKVLLSLFAKIIQRCEELSRPWRELTVPVQVSWMPPPAWIVNDLPKKKAEEIRSSMGYDVSNDVIELEAFLSDPKRMKRSSDKMDFQAKYVIPRLREGQCEQSRRLKVAPRRSAEEITLRALIFCSEVDRLDGLQQMLDVMVRCQERGLPFWTSAEREALFDYLCNVEGSKSPEEMAADLDEKEWWNSEIEELFIPIEEESDMEWRAIRNLEIKHPVKVITTTAMSVETMAGKVRSRIALQESGEIMKQLLEESKGGKGLDDVNGELPRFDDLKELMAKQISLKKEIDRSRYMTPEEIAEREQDRKERIEKVERERKNAIVAKALETNSVVFEGHDDILGTSKNDEDESLQLGV